MNKLFKKLLSLFTISVFILGIATPTLAESVVGPGPEKVVYPLTAGQNIDVGNVTVWNDSENLYVQYNTTNDWFMKENQLDVILSAPATHPTPGQLTYKRESGELLQTYLVEVPLTGFKNVTDFYIVAHTTVVKNGVNGETAWGGDIKGADGAWYYYIHYNLQDTGTVIVQKNINSSSGDPQANVTFTLASVDGKISLNGVTDNSGQITFSKLPFGNYTLTENVPDGYTTDLTSQNNIIIVSSEVPVMKQVINTKNTLPPVKGTIIVQKNIDSADGDPQADVSFTLTNGTDTLTKATDAEGQIIFDNLTLGTYTLTENVPDGYTTDLTTQNNTIMVTSEVPVMKQVINTKNTLPPVKGTIIVQKNIDSADGDPQADVSFTLTNGTDTFTKATDTEGQIIFDNLTLGTYTLTENVPDGYTTDLTTQNNTIMVTSEVPVMKQVINTADIPDDDPPEGPTDIPSIKIVKTANKTTAKPGDTVKYSIAVTNDGNVDLTNVNVKDEMIGINETIAELKVGKTVYFKESYVIPEDTPAGDFKNVAIAKVQYEDEIIEKSDDVIIEIIEDPVDIEDEDPPYGPTLPQTGGVSADMFYMVGGMIILTGFAMLKKRK